MPAAPRSGAGNALAEAAEYYLKHTPRGFRGDCSGFVGAAASRAGLDLSGNTEGMWRVAQANGGVHHRKRPLVGDLAFFDQTYDRNRNGRLDDELTHVAVVLEVHGDGRLLLAHGGTSQGRTTIWMDLDRPDQRFDDQGNELNGYLRAQRGGDPKRTPYLAGQLWRGFATVEGDWFGVASN